MTWTTPTNVSTGTASSSHMNTEVIANLQHLFDSMPLGRIHDASGGTTGAMGSIGNVVEHPSSGTTITNSDTETRQYSAVAVMTFHMVSGTNGLYRAVITNDSLIPYTSPTYHQAMCTVVATAGEVQAMARYDFTIAASASLPINCGALRVNGGSSSDTSPAARLTIYDLGRV